jgi:mRNA interferase RelE/StbE
VAAYSVVIKRSAEKEIEHLPVGIRRLVVRRILALADDPRPHGSQKLAGEDKYRIRQGDYRVVYTIEDAIVTVTVVRVAHRSDVYR